VNPNDRIKSSASDPAPSPPGFAGGEGRGEGGQYPSRKPTPISGSLSPLTPIPSPPAKPGGEGSTNGSPPHEKSINLGAGS
jgi:hypothetical protein